MIEIGEGTATWVDGDVSVSVAYSHDELDRFGPRTAWAYTIRVGDWVHEGDDLRSPVTDVLDPAGQLASLVSFLSSDGERYRRLLGPAPEGEDGYLFPLWLAEWAYLNEDVLSMVSLELSEDGEG